MPRHQIEVDEEKSIYSQGLAVVLTATRADRPSEWQMDEHADLARDLEQEVERLKGAIREHNQELNTMCGMGERCGRDRKKIRACPDCPRDHQILTTNKG